MERAFRAEFTAIEEDDTRQWFWDIQRQALFCASKASNQLFYLMSVPQKKMKKDYFCVKKYNSKLIMMPQMANDILLYDIDTGISSKIQLPEEIWNRNTYRKGLFQNGIIFGNEVILLPSWSGVICKLNIERECITAFRDISGSGINLNGSLPFGNAVLKGDYIYMVACNIPKVFIIHVHTLKYTIKTFTDYEGGFCSIVVHGKDYWLFPRYRGGIIKWNPDTNREERFSIPAECLSLKDRAAFNCVEGIGRDIWLFPAREQDVVRIDIKSGIVEREEIFKKYSAYDDEGDNYIKYRMAKAQGAVLKVYSTKKGMLIYYDTEHRHIQESPYYLSNAEEEKYFTDIGISGCNMIENREMTFSEYLIFIQKKDFVSPKKKTSYGERIYQESVN